MKYIKRVSKVKNDDTKGYIINSTNVVDKEHNTYSAKIIDELVLDNYSTGEQVVGTWIDGKPLYRQAGEKTVYNNTTLLYGIANYNFKRVTGWIIREDGFENQVGVYTGENDHATIYRSSDKNSLSFASSYTGTLIYEVYYTKTTS